MDDAVPWCWMAQRPLRFLRSSAPWRCWLYVATGAPLGLVTMAAIAVLTLVGAVLSPIVVGLALLTAAGLSGIAVGAVERRRLRLLGVDAPPSPHRAAGSGSRWLRTRLHEAATWRELAFTLHFALGLWLVELVAAAVPVALVAGLWQARSAETAAWAAALALPVLVAAVYLVTAVASLHVMLVRSLLAGVDVDRQGWELIASNGRLLDAFDAERRRIERDLHDGAQQRLVALAVMLDVARMKAGNGDVGSLLTRAHAEATTTIAQLRDLVAGIHPQSLTERGLTVAVAELAARQAIPVDLRVRLAGRLPLPVESTAFFVVSEALANIAKHANAERAWVSGQLAGDLLVLEIGDDGRGGADPGAGSGVRGLADRVVAVGGKLLLASPVGGPTVLRAEIPCRP